jgi:hypothetical protein
MVAVSDSSEIRAAVLKRVKSHRDHLTLENRQREVQVDQISQVLDVALTLVMLRIDRSDRLENLSVRIVELFHHLKTHDNINTVCTYFAIVCTRATSAAEIRLPRLDLQLRLGPSTAS